MDVADAIHSVLGELHRVLASKSHVSGVEAEMHVTRVEDPVDVVSGFHQSLHVGVQNLLEPVLGTNVVDDAKHLSHVTLLGGV